MAINRSISVNSKGLVAPINYVYAETAIDIVLSIADYTIPTGATASVYASVDGGTAYTQTATISDNTVTISPTAGLFQPGKNKMQVEITANSKLLVTFAIDVNCENQISGSGSTSASSVRTAAQIDADLSTLRTTVNNKVDKVSGKALSTNDYDDAEKGKVASLDYDSQYHELRRMNFIAGWINNGVSKGTVVSLDKNPSTNYSYCIVNCSQGDCFILNGTGGQSARLWSFIDSENIQLSFALVNTTADNLLITAPASAAKLVVNMQNATIGDCYRKPIAKIENSVNDISGVVATNFNHLMLLEEMNTNDVDFAEKATLYLGIASDTGEEKTMQNYKTTDYIYVSKGTRIVYDYLYATSAYDVIAVYDLGKNYDEAKSVKGTGSSSRKKGTINVTENCFIRVSVHQGDHENTATAIATSALKQLLDTLTS